MKVFAEEPRVGYALRKPLMTAAEFLAWDETQTIKHEFIRGEVFAMTGGVDRNNTVTLNLAIALRQHLKSTPCRVYALDVKLRVEAADCYFYPDLMVTCSPDDAADRLVKREPKLVVEVLSPSTASFDRGAKFTDYRLLPALKEYLLVDVDRQHCDLYRKGSDGLWVLHPAGPQDAVRLASVDLQIDAATLWADLEPEEDGTGSNADSAAA
jgi:Uma2 family endonuclease